LGIGSSKDKTCSLESEKHEDRGGYVSVSHFEEHAASGCDKCCLLPEIAVKFKGKITHFKATSDWTSVRFKTGPKIDYFSVDLFAPQGIER
jgi:ABC-type polysaccharide/polyol phosphate transport system ATPase subunit